MFIAAIAAEVHRALDPGESVAPIHQSRARRLPSGRVATLATSLVLTGGLAAAAATGSLPAPIQRALSHGIAHIGIRLPLPHAAGPTVPTPVTATTVTKRASGTRTAASNLGPCETYLHVPHSASPRVPIAADRARQTARLATAAASHNEGVRAYCESLVHPNAGPVPSVTIAPASTTPSRPPTTPRGSHAPSTVPVGSRHQRTHQTGVHTPGTTTAGTGSAQPGVSSLRSVTHGTGAPADSTKSGHMGTGSTTTSSLAITTAPATSTSGATSSSGARPVNSHNSNKGGEGVSAAQTN